jgi:major membrane immunogen (membrane-anchored lipoprotein)
MKKRGWTVLTVLFALCSIFVGCGGNAEGPYKDGEYEGKSGATTEGYYGKANVTVKKGRIDKVDFKIYDTAVFKSFGNSKHKDADELLLDETYKNEVYETAPGYQEQTENELKGIEKYEGELVEKQAVDEVDAISGATWSYELFQETLKDTLEQARK